MAKNLQEIMDAINEMEIEDGGRPGDIDENEIKDYVKNEINGTRNEDERITGYLTELMARNPKIRKDLKESLPNTNKSVKEKMARLRTDASRKGMDKFLNDFKGTKKRAAKRELAEIAARKRKVFGNPELKKDADKSIDTGRGRHHLTALVNYVSLGSHDERHDGYEFEGDDLKREFDHETPDGLLHGAYYEPKVKNPSGKVVIFFSGSGGSAARYSKNVVEEYMKQGVPVYCMDYRGFGDSITTNKKGEKISTPLSEASMYKDGKEMLKYVIKDMKIKPENVILHGFSMGGAVASKVAADFAQSQQKKALEEGRNVKKLGGVVLHSPIATMKEAARDAIMDGFRGIPYVGKFLAATLGRAIGSFFGKGAWAHGGAYNTRSHMQRLHKYDPDIPVHYASGSSSHPANPNDVDQLSIEQTHIHRDKKAQFKNSTATIGSAGHEGTNFKAHKVQDMLNNKRSDTIEAQLNNVPKAPTFVK